METFYYGQWLYIILMIWVLPWKGYALWTASKKSQRGWFIVLLILNTLAILEIFYIFFIAKKKWSEIKKEVKEGWNHIMMKESSKAKKEE